MFTTFAGTTSGVRRIDHSGHTPLGLEGERIAGIYGGRDDAGREYVLAGTYGNGLFRSADGGKTWQPVTAGMTAPAFRVICPDPFDTSALLCGTEPARLFRSRDYGLSWQELEGIHALEGYEDWYLPYSPRAGAVRNVYAPDSRGSRLLASVEVGGLIETRDRGRTWQYVLVGHDPDLHHITGHPDDPDLLYASLGYAALKRDRRPADGSGEPRLGGVARSRDGGASWTKLHSDYTRSTIIPPTHPHLLLAGPAPYVGREGRIEVSSNGGDSWEPAAHGITTPMPDMVEYFHAAPDNSIWAVCSGGRLLRAEAGEWHWSNVIPEGAGIEVVCVSFLPDA